MKGKEEPENPTDRQCKHCGRWFSLRGHPPHEENCDFQEVDATLQPLTEEGAAPTTHEPKDDKGPDPSTSPAPEPKATTDGGIREPPEPKRTDGGKDKSETVPDRFLSVGEYLQRFERKNPETAQTDDFREWAADLHSRGEWVDVEETTTERVRVLQSEEVPGA